MGDFYKTYKNSDTKALEEIEEQALAKHIETGVVTLAVGVPVDCVKHCIERGGYVVIKAHSNNTDVIYIGHQTHVSTEGFDLAAGESFTASLERFGDLKVLAKVTGQNYRYYAAYDGQYVEYLPAS